MMDNAFRPDGLVVGIDPSLDSHHAAEWAAARAVASDRPLHLVAAQSPETDEGWDHDHLSTRTRHDLHHDLLIRLQGSLHAQHPSLHISLAATDRLPAKALVLAARRSRLVVLGSHGESLLRWSLGSTAHQVAVHAPCSVAVVRDERDDELRRTLVGVDDPQDLTGLQWALQDADHTGAEAYAVHVADRDESRGTEAARGRTEAALERAVREAAAPHPDVKVRGEVLEGNPIRTLLHQAHDHDLIIIGARGRGGFTGLTLGHVAGALLERSDCTVVIAR